MAKRALNNDPSASLLMDGTYHINFKIIENKKEQEKVKLIVLTT